MKKIFLFLIAISFSLLSFSQDYVVLRLGSTDVSTLLPGDTVLVPVYCDDISNSMFWGWQVGFSFNGSVIEFVLGLINVNPKFEGSIMQSLSSLPGGFIGYDATWLGLYGETLDPGDKFFDIVFVYQEGETDLTWTYSLFLDDFNGIGIDGCICNQITHPVIFHIEAEGSAIENAEVEIDGEVHLTDLLGMTVFDLPNGSYSYTATYEGYSPQSDDFDLDDDPQIIYVDMEAEETYPLTFICNVSCENNFNGWNLVINDFTLSPGETIYLPEGDWGFSLSWLDCTPTIGSISVTGQIEFECGFAGDIEPHVTFHVISGQGGDIKYAKVTVEPYTVFTNAFGEAGFCLPGGDLDYIISKEGYDTITGNFSYVNYCEDASVEVLMDPLKVMDKTYANFQIYPNPSKGIFIIESVEAKKGPIEIYVMDLTGRTIFQNTFNNISKFQMDLSDQKKGLYFLQIKSDSILLNSKLLFK